MLANPTLESLRLTIVDPQKRGVERRRYNAPSSNEVAVLIVNDGKRDYGKDLILTRQDSTLHRIREDDDS
jgi:hypothetical protein